MIFLNSRNFARLSQRLRSMGARLSENLGAKLWVKFSPIVFGQGINIIKVSVRMSKGNDSQSGSRTLQRPAQKAMIIEILEVLLIRIKIGVKINDCINN